MKNNIKVLLPGPYHIPIERQFPSSNLVWGNCIFTFDIHDDYDYLAIIDDIPWEFETSCPKERRLIFLGEPPYVKHYNKEFLNKFDNIFTCQSRMVKHGEAAKSYPVLSWMVGCNLKSGVHICEGDNYMSYADFQSFQNKQEITDKVCLLTSNKTFTKGHRERVHFANRAITENHDLVDVYGNGYNSVADKLDVLGRYKYALVVENCIYPDYWTEKIGDAFLAGCTIFYHGCPNIGDYFPKEGIIKVDIRNYEETIRTMERVVSNHISTDQKILDSCKDLVLNKYNLFNVIAEKVENHARNGVSFEKLSTKETLAPMTFRTIDKIKNRITRRFNIDL